LFEKQTNKQTTLIDNVFQIKNNYPSAETWLNIFTNSTCLILSSQIAEFTHAYFQTCIC